MTTRLSLRYLWPILLIGSIIYAAGPNGAWMARQFSAPMPAGWGWFGAVLLGLAIFGGIKLAAGPQRRLGVSIAAVGGLVAVVIDTQYFTAAGHGSLLALALGAFPTLLAVLAGIVEASAVTVAEERANVEAAARLAWELREASKDRAVARRLTQPATQVNAAVTQSDAAVAPATLPVDARTYRCAVCGRNGMNRFAYAAHVRYCQPAEVEQAVQEDA